MSISRLSHKAFLSVGLAALLTVAPFASSVALAQGQGQGRPTASPLNVPITGTAADTVIAATFNVQRFAVQQGALVAVGTLTGTATNTVTGLVTNFIAPLAIPVNTAQTTATCEILNLVLGPLDLNLLGLAVHLDRVVLNITAVPGAGNLLGNLLCAVAGLLDGNGALAGLAGLLNNLLVALSSL